MASTKTLRGNTTLWAAHPEAFTAAEWLTGLSAAKFAAGIIAGLIEDISAAVEDGYTLNGTGDTTDNSMTVVDITEIESPLFKQYEGSLDLFRNKPGTTDTPAFDAALAWFDAVDTPVNLIKRVDKAQGTAVAAGDILSAHGFDTDYSQDAVDDNGMLMFGARFKPTGFIAPNLTAIA